MKFIDLKHHLSLKEFSTCYVIFGEDEQVLLSAENLFKNQIEEAFRDFNILSFESKETEPQRVVDACNTMPLMASKKLVILKDDDSKEEKKDVGEKTKANPIVVAISNYLKEPNNSTILVIKTREGSAFYNKLKTTATLVDCKKLDTITLKKFINSELRKKKITIADPEILKLIDICGGNLGNITTELQKLTAIAENGVITSQNINENCTKNLEYSVFELSEAISNKNTQRAIQILDDMLQSPKNQPLILPLLASHFRRLFMVATSTGSAQDKANKLGIKEYAVQKAEELSKKFSKKKLMDITKLIGESEFLVKSGKAGLLDTLYYIVLYILNN